jgi:predicted thioredoxin/glutaredoxin
MEEYKEGSHEDMVSTINKQNQEVVLLRAEVVELNSKIKKMENKSIDLIIQEKIDEAVLSLDLIDQNKVESIVYDEVDNQLDDAKDDIVNKTIERIVSRLEY